jgi:hypothetical protein
MTRGQSVSPVAGLFSLTWDRFWLKAMSLSISIEAFTAMSGFEQALKKLIEDPRYGEAVIKDPKRLTDDYKQLDLQEILLLMQVWHASGDPRALPMIVLCHCCTSHLAHAAGPSSP